MDVFTWLCRYATVGEHFIIVVSYHKKFAVVNIMKFGLITWDIQVNKSNDNIYWSIYNVNIILN